MNLMKKNWLFKSHKTWLFILYTLALIGLFDAIYLTYEHYNPQGGGVACSFGIFSDCGRVLRSKYSEIFGIPVAIFGVVQYFIEFIAVSGIILLNINTAKRILTIFSVNGLLVSIYLIVLQLFVIGSICPYCMLSALVSILIFSVTFSIFSEIRVWLIGLVTRLVYKYLLRPLIFLTNSDSIHELAIGLGEKISIPFFRKIFSYFYNFQNRKLTQTVLGIKFKNPMGLAAGFDYDAKLTQIIDSIGFGFETVGTITNNPYEGNSPPRLGRLPKSKSLLVNKGFKNSGADAIIKKLQGKIFSYPLGVSIGRTNSRELVTQKQSVEEVVNAFKKFEKSEVKHSYYELNISCPNLYGNISFYPPKNLEELLSAVDKLKIKKPVFVKMPIEKTDKDTLTMLKIIAKHSPKGVIFGNLQTDRKNKVLDPEEVKKWKAGKFSGKPTFERSNELIELAYKNFADRFVILGCGGVFNAEDTYTKIKKGATLVQFITGLIFEGPQLASNINSGLVELLEKDGYKNISEAVGVDVKMSKRMS